MRTVAIAVLAILVLAACKHSTTADCAGSIGKGIDQLRERRKQRLALVDTQLSPAARAQIIAQEQLMDTYYLQLRTTLAKRCTEDSWPSEVIDCYESAASAEAMRKCRVALPAVAAEHTRTDEVDLMSSMKGSAATPPAIDPRSASGSGLPK